MNDKQWVRARQLLRRKPNRYAVASGLFATVAAASIAHGAGLSLATSSGVTVLAAALVTTVTNVLTEIRGIRRDDTFGEYISTASESQLVLSCLHEAVVTRQLTSEDLAEVMTKALDVMSASADSAARGRKSPGRRPRAPQQNTASPRPRRSGRERSGSIRS